MALPEKEDMRNTKRFASLAAMAIMAIVCSASPMWGQDIRLAARKNKVINKIEAQLRGDYRESNGTPLRLNAELENINIPVGTPVAFCMVQNLVKTKIGVGKVAMVGGILVASVECNINDGNAVPKVNVRDKLQARQSAVAPFKTSPGCGAPLLVSAAFK
jgi:hypothetical protein